MKFILTALILISILKLVFCTQEHDRIKREQYESPSNRYSNYYGNRFIGYGSAYPSSEYNKPLVCKTPPPCANPNIFPDLNTTWPNVVRTWYVNMESCFGYSYMASQLLGREVRSERELDQMCPTVTFKRGSYGIVAGYGRQFMQYCPLQGCPVRFPDPGVDASKLPGTYYDLILDEEKTFALFYHCVGDRYASYTLFTPRPYVERSVAERAIEVILSFGFPRDEIRFYTCKPDNQVYKVAYPGNSYCNF